MKLRSILSLIFLTALLAGCTPAAAPVAAADPVMTAVPQTAPAETAAPDPAALGSELLQAGEYQGAIDAFTRALEQGADESGVRALLGAFEQAEAAGAGMFDAEKTALYEQLGRMDSAAEKDVLALSALYQSAGRHYDSCALLERSQLLAPTEEKQALLDALIIGVDSVPEEAAAVLLRLSDALAAGDTDAAAPDVLDDASFSLLASDIPGTVRRYRGDAADGGVLRVETERTLPGSERLTVWYLAPDGQAAYLSREGLALSVVKAVWADGAYTGAFSSLYLDAKTGSVFTDAGTLTNDLWTGEVTSTAVFGEAETTLPALWELRTATPSETYLGTFDGQGHAEADQRRGVAGVIYAYTGDEKAYLILSSATDADAYAFGLAELSLRQMPVW